MPKQKIPTQADVTAYLKRRNWGRWGKDDELGTINLITPEKRRQAASLVRSGRSVSLSRYFPVTPEAGNARPAQHWMRTAPNPEGGYAADFLGIDFHGLATTHIDAICHYWGTEGMYNGRKPDDVLNFEGATFGAIDKWSDGIVTRGVLADIPKYRRKPHITFDEPVHGWELEAAIKGVGLKFQPGDALVVYMGRDSWQRANPSIPYSTEHGGECPGLHASCLPFLRDNDVSVLVWDFLDHMPSGYKWNAPVHQSIWAYGLPLLDNSLLEPLSQACAVEKRYEFMLTIAPLKVAGGTGSPVNPIALF